MISLISVSDESSSLAGRCHFSSAGPSLLFCLVLALHFQGCVPHSCLFSLSAVPGLSFFLQPSVSILPDIMLITLPACPLLSAFLFSRLFSHFCAISYVLSSSHLFYYFSWLDFYNLSCSLLSEISIESLNHLSWKEALKVIWSNPCTAQGHLQLSQVLKVPSSLTLSVSRGGFHHLSGQPVPHHPYCKKPPPYVQFESPLFKFENISPCPITTEAAEMDRKRSYCSSFCGTNCCSTCRQCSHVSLLTRDEL